MIKKSVGSPSPLLELPPRLLPTLPLPTLLSPRPPRTPSTPTALPPLTPCPTAVLPGCGRVVDVLGRAGPCTSATRLLVGSHLTNNIAEAAALHLALTDAHSRGARLINVYCDSAVCLKLVNQPGVAVATDENLVLSVTSND